MKKKHILDCDILIAGGGPAGVPCALAAARSGARVILCQDRPMLGGNASSEIRMHIVGADGQRGEALTTEARETGIIEDIRLETCVTNPQRSPSLLDLILYDRVRSEPGIQLYLNTSVYGCEVKDNRIQRAFARRESTEEQFEINARIFIDCTGDGRLGAEAGAPFIMGREGSRAHDESLAETAEPDNHTLGSTILYQATQHPQPMPFKAPVWARKFTAEELKLRLKLDPEVFDSGLEYGYWWAEWGGHLDTIKDNEAIRDELIAIVFGLWDHIKNSGLYPGTENWAMDWFGWVPGKRESRRFEGLYKLTQQDIWQGQAFPDAIAYGGWPIDTHPIHGIDAVDEPPCTQTLSPYLFDIPLRACISATIPNLMFAGRNLSATHIAFASTRVMATCAVVGEGVGVAAAKAIADSIEPAQLPNLPETIQQIQQTLLKNDAFLIGVRNEDPADKARRARLSASSHQAGGEPELVISGQSRSVHGTGGAHPDRSRPSSHRWMSNPESGLPAWLQLEWDEPIDIEQVRLTFDTGLHRRLALTHSDAFARHMHWGMAAPETVKSYRIWVRDEQRQETELLHIEDNYQRLRVHTLEAKRTITSLRIAIESTNGIDHARICEVRVY